MRDEDRGNTVLAEDAEKSSQQGVYAMYRWFLMLRKLFANLTPPMYGSSLCGVNACQSGLSVRR